MNAPQTVLFNALKSYIPNVAHRTIIRNAMQRYFDVQMIRLYEDNDMLKATIANMQMEINDLRTALHERENAA